MNQKLLVFLCSIISFCYAAQREPHPLVNKLDLFSEHNKKEQEDRYVIGEISKNEGYLVGVLDGHAGPHVANYITKHFPKKFSRCLEQSLTVEESFDQALLYLENHVINNFKRGGSTAAFVYIGNDGIACVANIGDSRAVFGNKNAVTFATQDHTLKRKDERERVLNAGGIISREKSKNGKYVGPWRINGLAPSRTLGDAWAKGRRSNRVRGVIGAREMVVDGNKIAIIAEQWPDICLKERLFYKPQVGQVIAQQEYTEHQLIEADRWGVIASDGLWDVVSNEDALTLVQQYYDQGGELKGIANFLCECAMKLGSEDNITVMVIDLLSDVFQKKI